MKICVGLFVIASVAFLSIGSSAQASTTCSGVTVTITGLPSSLDGVFPRAGGDGSCSASVPFTQEQGNVNNPFVGASSTTFTPNSVSANTQAGLGGDVGTKGTLTDSNIFVELPIVQNGSGPATFGTASVNIGGITFDLSTTYLRTTDHFDTSVTGSTPIDAKATVQVTATITKFVGGQSVVSLATAQAAGVQVSDENASGLRFSCGFTGTPSCGAGSIPLGDEIRLTNFGTTTFNGVGFKLDLGLETQLNSDSNPGSSTTFKANDPVTFALLDANGQVIPGVTFIESDTGFDFGSPETTATPLPAALPLFASGLGAMGLIGWRRRRKGGRSPEQTRQQTLEGAASGLCVCCVQRHTP
jgi:hypothetical protein